MNPNPKPSLRPHDPFDDSAHERQKRMGLLTSDGQPSTVNIEAFCTLYAGLFFDDLCDCCGDFNAAIAICRNLIVLSQREEPRRMLLAISVQYDTMQRSLPDPIWWIAGNQMLVDAFTQGFSQRLQLLVDSEVPEQ